MGIVHVNVRNIFPSTEGVGLYRGSLFTSSVIPVIGVIDTYCEIDINFNISLILNYIYNDFNKIVCVCIELNSLQIFFFPFFMNMKTKNMPHIGSG